MRPKRSGYKSQAKILALFQETPTLRYKQIKEQLSIDDHTLSRNLKVLTESGVLKKESGYKGYSVTSRFHSLLRKARVMDLSQNVQEMLKQPAMSMQEEEEFFRSLLKGKLPPTDWELVEPSSFEEEEELSRKYQQEISALLKLNPDLDGKLLFSWAKYRRKIKRRRAFGARERIVGPKTKRPSSFKPKCG